MMHRAGEVGGVEILEMLQMLEMLSSLKTAPLCHLQAGCRRNIYGARVR